MSLEKLVEGLKEIAIGKQLMSFPEGSENETRKEQVTDPMDSLIGQPNTASGEPYNQNCTEPNPSTGHRMIPCGKDTWEYQTLFANQAKLADQLADTPGVAVRLSSELYARKIIGKPVWKAANIRGPGVTEIVRVQPILTAMLAKIDLNPKKYYAFRAAMLVPNVDVDRDVVNKFVPEKDPMDSLTGQPFSPSGEPHNLTCTEPNPSTGLLDEPRPKPAAPTMFCATADRKCDISTQKKKCSINPKCRRFIRLIGKLSSILGRDPESDALALGHMKLSLAILKGQDESIAIDPEVYRGAKTVQEFFKVMSKYWSCYTDHDLLAMVIEATENKEAIDVLKCFLQSKDPRAVIPVAKLPDAPFWQVCNDSGSSVRGKQRAAGSLQEIEGKHAITSEANQQKVLPALQKAFELPQPEQKMTLQMISAALSRADDMDPINFTTPADISRQTPADPSQQSGKEEKIVGVPDETAATKQRSCSTNLVIGQQPQLNAPDPESSEALESLEYLHHHPVQSHELPPKRVPVVAEVSLSSITYGMYNCLKGAVASVLKTPREALCLCGTFKGSCIVVWHVSEEIAAGIKRIQLSPDDQTMLLQCAVMKMSCGEKCLFNIAEEELQEMVTSDMIPEFAETASEPEGAEGGEMEPKMQGRMRAITRDVDFERELKNAGESLVVADFKADWCGPSFAMNPKFAALSEQYPEVEFLSVDVDECEATAARYNVDAVPTFAFFRKRQLLHQVVGADMQAVECGILQAESAVPGQMCLNSLINTTGSECLNENDSHPFKNALTAGEEYLESDCDEQLIVSLTFQKPVKLHTLQIVGPPDGRAPKRVKLFTNQIHTLDFDSAEQRKAVQEFDLTEEDVKQDSLLSLAYVKFQNVQNLTVFIQDNQGGEETTVVSHLGIFGTPLHCTNMEAFQRVSGVKGEIHVKGYGGCL